MSLSFSIQKFLTMQFSIVFVVMLAIAIADAISPFYVLISTLQVLVVAAVAFLCSHLFVASVLKNLQALLDQYK